MADEVSFGSNQSTFERLENLSFQKKFWLFFWNFEKWCKEKAKEQWLYMYCTYVKELMLFTNVILCGKNIPFMLHVPILECVIK